MIEKIKGKFNKKDSNSKRKNKKSIKTKLIIIPIILIALTISAIVATVCMETESSIKDQMSHDTGLLLKNVEERLKDNEKSVEELEGLAESTIARSLTSVKNRQDNNLNSEEISNLGELVQVDEINLYDTNGQIISSNVAENIGHQLDASHPIVILQNSGEDMEIEEIRIAERSDGSLDGYFKYGAIKNSDNTVFQLGMNVDNIVEISEQLSHEALIESLMSSEEIDYAGYIGGDLIGGANSNPDYVGMDMSSDEELVGAINSGEIVASEQNFNDADVYDIIHPIIIDGENQGALRIGIRIDSMNQAIRNSVIKILLMGIGSILLIGFILFKISNEIINIIDSLRDDMEMMAKGDFSMDPPEEFQAREDEFGEISRANMTMKESIRNILDRITREAEVVASYSEELTATTQESELAANELSTTIEEIAHTASSQAQDVENGSNVMMELNRLMVANNLNLEKLNKSTEEIDSLKDEGVDVIGDLVVETEEVRQAIREISEVVDETNRSTGNIVEAIEMIQSIAEQTNLLALNAAIEAARAGESGRGFAVVAEEIRKLAEDSSKFTSEIELIVNDLTSKSSVAVETMKQVEEIIESQGEGVERTDTTFDGITLSIEEIHGLIEEVNKSNQAMAKKEERLRSLMENLAAVAEENAAGTQQSSASIQEQNAIMTEINNASGELAQTAESLNNEASIFVI